MQYGHSFSRFRSPQTNWLSDIKCAHIVLFEWVWERQAIKFLDKRKIAINKLFSTCSFNFLACFCRLEINFIWFQPFLPILKWIYPISKSPNPFLLLNVFFLSQNLLLRWEICIRGNELLYGGKWTAGIHFKNGGADEYNPFVLFPFDIFVRKSIFHFK